MYRLVARRQSQRKRVSCRRFFLQPPVESDARGAALQQRMRRVGTAQLFQRPQPCRRKRLLAQQHDVPVGFPKPSQHLVSRFFVQLQAGRRQSRRNAGNNAAQPQPHGFRIGAAHIAVAHNAHQGRQRVHEHGHVIDDGGHAFQFFHDGRNGVGEGGTQHFFRQAGEIRELLGLAAAFQHALHCGAFYGVAPTPGAYDLQRVVGQPFQSPDFMKSAAGGALLLVEPPPGNAQQTQAMQE